MKVQVVILAAGEGKRMHSKLPKVMHCLGGKPLLEHVIENALHIASAYPPIIVHGYQGKLLQDTFGHYPVAWIEQKEQLGTAHAVLQALPNIPADTATLILYGDVPLLSLPTLKKFIAHPLTQDIRLMSAHFSDPSGYGRILRDANQHVVGIIEEKEATETERAIKEINSGIYFLPTHYLKKWLMQLSNNNAQREYYLTDIIACASQEKVQIQTLAADFNEEVMGVNDRKQLAYLERFYQRRLAENLMVQGVTLMDPSRLDIRGEVVVGQDVVIDVNVLMEGRVSIADGCHIGPNTILRNATIGERVEIKANSIIDGAEIAEDCIIGPFARLRPGSILGPHVHIGNFVEIKNSEIAQCSKVNHLSYIGDSKIGQRVNIGAGTITCNYDGFNKHKTIIGDDTHIGSDTQLVAPVTIGMGATIGAGSTITKDAPPYQLTVTHRIEQRSIENWQRPGTKSDNV